MLAGNRRVSEIICSIWERICFRYKLNPFGKRPQYTPRKYKVRPSAQQIQRDANERAELDTRALEWDNKVSHTANGNFKG